MKQPSIAVFDLGNVLLQWNPRFLFRKIMADEQRMEWFLTHVCNMDWILERDRGSSFVEGAQEASQRFPDFAYELRAFNERWHETLPGVIPGTVSIIEELQAKGVPLYAITNFNGEKFRETLQRFPILGAFRDIVVSGDERLLKPDPAIYAVLLKRNSLLASDCLFIDDNQGNVDGAKAVGFYAHHFTCPASLRDELIRYGLL